MSVPDGKMHLADVADTEQLLRLIQSIPSKIVTKQYAEIINPKLDLKYRL